VSIIAQEADEKKDKRAIQPSQWPGDRAIRLSSMTSDAQRTVHIELWITTEPYHLKPSS
jgi:hypothetical protein